MRLPPLITGVFYFMEEKKYVFVRRATEKDYDLRKSRIEKSKIKTDFSKLQSISNEIIELHEKYYHDKLSYHISKTKQRHDQRMQNYIDKVNHFIEKRDYINSGVKPSLQCECKGNLTYSDFETYKMIGCDNYRDKNFEHYKLYFPNKYDNEDFNFDLCIERFEVSKLYLSDIIKQLPFKCRASDLYEFLTLNNIKLHREDITRDYFTTAKKCNELSNKREQIILGQLQKKYKKIERHILIAYQLNSEKFIRFVVPDIIAFDNKDIIIFEQKKSIDNVNLNQTDLYVELIKEMVNETYNVLVKYIIEEDYDCIPEFINKHEILTLKNL